VARGDFNVWSDVDVLVAAANLPSRAPERAGLLMAVAPSGVQVVGFEPSEFDEAFRRIDPMTREAVTVGVVLRGEDYFERLRSSSTP
jgi:predicted nucleotidyltransferase